MGANGLGADAVSEFTDKSLFKERLPSFSQKALFEVQKRLLHLPPVTTSCISQINSSSRSFSVHLTGSLVAFSLSNSKIKADLLGR